MNMKISKFTYYVFVFFIGMLFKLVDDLLDMPEIFPEEIKKYVFLIQLLFIFSLSYILYYETNIIPLLFLTTISGYYIDNKYNLDNINDVFWYLSSFMIIIYFIVYLYFNINSFIIIYSQFQVWLIIVLMYFLALFEMLYFKEEVSLEKIIFRLLVVISFTSILIFNYFTKNDYLPKLFNKILILLDGYALMSVINMSYAIHENIDV